MAFGAVDNAKQYNFSQSIRGLRPSCFCSSQVSNSFVSTKADVTSRVRFFSSQSSHHLSMWLNRAKQCEVVHAPVLSLPVLWLLLIVRNWHALVLPSNTRLIRSSTTTKKWKMRIENPSRMASKLIGLNLRSLWVDIRYKSKSQA